MKSLDKIPTGKLERAKSLVKTGAKIGVNYAKYFGNKVVSGDEVAKKKLHEDNAADIYDSLKELKGSALKVAQMLSMENGMLPQEYVERFSLAQFSVPPLSSALVRKVFRSNLGKNPEDLFDSFSPESVNAASIGQVHKAKKGGKELAVKIQYPGVRDSIHSDLQLIKPIAMRMFNIPKEGSAQYFEEVEQKLFEETDYKLELKRGKQISEACKHIPNLVFPEYHEQWSSDKILTMDWLDGIHLSELNHAKIDDETRNKLGQTLWNFYMYQMHNLRAVQADPHPGNFLVSKNHELMAIDFGCIKEIPEDFYTPYFALQKNESLDNEAYLVKIMTELGLFRDDDSAEEKAFLLNLMQEMLGLFGRPFKSEYFDFSDEKFFAEISTMGQKFSKMSELRSINSNRGSKHFIYINRTFFGLYSMMHHLKANHIEIDQYKKFD